MMKKISIIALSSVLASCTVGSNAPIRSATDPSDEIKREMYEQSYGYENATQLLQEESMTLPEPNVVMPPEEPQMVETAPMVAEAQPSMPVEQQAQPDMPKIEEKSAASVDASKIDVTKTNFGAVGTYKIGNPYLIDGVSYYPHEDYEYSEIGIASWYGPNFHGGKTSNGETFNEKSFSAAHRTLPMPSLVRVTNLENGVSVDVKVNDRGPYARDRIIDLSSAAADALNMKDKGTARVKVEILKEESMKLKDLAMESKNTDIYPSNISLQPVKIVDTKTEDKKQVVEPITETQNITSVATPEVKGDYFVQVAAFSNYEKAEDLKNKLLDIGTVKIFKSVIDGDTFYKVRLGEFATKEDAVKTQSEVTKSGIKGSRVILKENGTFKWYNVK